MTTNDPVHGLTVLAAALERLRAMATHESHWLGLHCSVFAPWPPGVTKEPFHETHRALFAHARDGSGWALMLAVVPDGPEAPGATGELIAFQLEPKEYAQSSTYELGRVIVRRLEALSQRPSIRYRVSPDGRILLLTDDMAKGPLLTLIGLAIDRRGVQDDGEGDTEAWRYPHPDTANAFADALHEALGL